MRRPCRPVPPMHRDVVHQPELDALDDELLRVLLCYGRAALRPHQHLQLLLRKSRRVLEVERSAHVSEGPAPRPLGHALREPLGTDPQVSPVVRSEQQERAVVELRSEVWVGAREWARQSGIGRVDGRGRGSGSRATHSCVPRRR